MNQSSDRELIIGLLFRNMVSGRRVSSGDRTISEMEEKTDLAKTIVATEGGTRKANGFHLSLEHIHIRATGG